MLLEQLLRLAVGGLAGHIVERFQQALLGAVDVLQVVFEQLIERRDWHADAPFRVIVNAPHGAKEKNSAGARPGLAQVLQDDSQRTAARDLVIER